MYIHLRVFPESKRARIEKRGKDSFLVCVREKAERNMANKSALSAMAAHLKLPLRKIRIVSGHRQPSKIISVDD